METLPEKPSELIRVALEDLEKCEQDPRYEIDMSTWHAPNGACRVCLAGAVIAQRLNWPITERVIHPNVFVTERRKLLALDAAREGCVSEMLDFLDINTPPGFDHEWELDREIEYHCVDRKAFKADMLQLANDLEAAGL